MTAPHVTSPLAGRPPGVIPSPEEELATAVAGCPDVAALSGGPFGEVATYLPGRRIVGVRLLGDRFDVHVIARWGTPLPAVAEQVRSACAPFAGGRGVDVTIEDVVPVPGDGTPSAGSAPTAESTHQATP